MEIMFKHGTDYFVYYMIEPNKYGLTHILHDKIKNEWWLVHASTFKFPMKYENGLVSGLLTFYV
jgi:hypothetical protein